MLDSTLKSLYYKGRLKHMNNIKAIKTWSAWTTDEENKLKFLVADKNKRIAEIAKEFPDKTFYSVKGKMKTLGLKATNNKDWTKEEDDVLRENYATIKSLHDLVPRLPGRNYDSLRSRANLLGLLRWIDFTCDENYFETPNIQNCSLAGYIGADGCIQNTKTNLKLEFHISRDDEKYLLKIKELLKFTGNITYSEHQNKIDFVREGKHYFSDKLSLMCKMGITSKKLCLDLEKNFNIVPRKTHILKAPNITDIKQKLAYISGSVDGDGYITKTDRKDTGNESYIIGFMGTTELISWIKQTLDSLVPSNKENKFKSTDSANVVEYKIMNARAYWLGKMFLSLDINRLDRKWDKIKEWISKVESGQISKKQRTYITNITPRKEILDLFNISPIIPESVINTNNIENIAA